MKELTSRERFLRMFSHQTADRIPIMDSPWDATIARWRSEGMPETVDWADFFGLDRVAGFSVDKSPRYPEKTVEETDAYRIYKWKWGVTMKSLQHSPSTPEFEAFTVCDREPLAVRKQLM